MKISRSTATSNAQAMLLACTAPTQLKALLTPAQLAELKVRNKQGESQVELYQNGQHLLCMVLPKGNDAATLEKLRAASSKAIQRCQELRAKEVGIHSSLGREGLDHALIEGAALANYRFNRHLSKPKDAPLARIKVAASSLSANAIKQLGALMDAVHLARDLVNEPLNHLNAKELASAAKMAGKEAGFKVEVFNKQKIAALKMGGLLAVNQGSLDPPTFTIMEWKPKSAVNSSPMVLVGKGIVYDTGGLSLKPTPNSMDQMKCDMGGAAAVIGAMYAVAAQNLPVHLVALVPATDNRPGGNAYAPGDVITMYDGQTVEVLNTDAEGRLVMADAISYAEKYQPELIVDLATLTGSAAHAIGTKGSVIMGSADQKVLNTFQKCGEQVHERVAQFPFWEEYDEELDSPIADMKNIGGTTGGAITAGKFLNRFTKRPHVHIDIAGTAFLDTAEAYRPKGGTGVGVRLLVATIKAHYGIG